MSKFLHVSIALTFIFVLIGTFFVSQAVAETNYYSNNFDSASALNDGYWSCQDSEIQAMNGLNVLYVNGEASFKPEHGNYDLNNFTVQFDVWHNVVYQNNTAYQGSFYEGADSEGNVIIRMGYVQRGTNDNLQQTGFVSFAAGPNGETYSHYYFPFDHSADWSTWRLTAVIVKTEGPYFANITLQINNQEVTSFVNDFEQTLSSITNEEIFNPVTYHSLLPLPLPGAPVPTYIPTCNSKSSIQYELMSNIRAKSVLNNNGATPSYVDNFYYGYANMVPLSATSKPALTTAPIPRNGVDNPSNNDALSTPTSTLEAPSTLPTVTIFLALLSIAIISVALIATILLVRIKKLKKVI
jgi:hypothetical protein